jgi:DNA-binding IclR family transcriptional regulator
MPPPSAVDQRTGKLGEETDAFEQKSPGNSTIVVGIKVLLEVSRMSGPASLSEIKVAAGMSASRAYRYLVSLTETGLLQQDPENGKYDLGPTAIEIGIAAMGRVDAIRLASDVMRTLTNKVNMVTILSVWGSNGATVIRWEYGRLDLAIRVREGLNLSLVSTATGRIFLAHMEREDLEPVLDRDLRGWNAIAAAGDRLDKKSLVAIGADVRQSGMSVTLGLRTPETGAIAAPIFDHTGRLRMALSLVGLVGTFDADPNAEPARELRAAAIRLSRLLGWDARRAEA